MTIFGSRRKANLAAALGLMLMTGWMGACSMKTQTQEEQDRQIQQNAAKTTEQLKAGAKVAAADAKVATAEAGRKLKDIAVGVRQGLHDKPGDSADSKPNAGRMDINSATQDELASLPGISSGKAQEIIDARPYESSHDLVTKGLLSESRYERIAQRLTAR